MALSRIEYKFLITTDEYEKIRFQIANVCPIDPHADSCTREYSLSSIYFEDCMDSYLLQKADGLEMHQKFRLRHYGGGVQRLEYKTKVGNLTQKDSLWVDEALFIALLEGNMDELYPHLDKSLMEQFVIKRQCDYLRPEIVIDYEREAYIYDVGDVRITFDKNLRARRYDQDPGFEQLLFEPKMMMLEVKYTEKLPQFLKTILFQKDFQQVSYSKYYAAWLKLIA